MDRRTLLVSAVAIAMAGAAHAATISIDQGNTNAGDTDNILYTGPGVVNGPATTVTGRANTNNFLVDITGNTTLFADGGQARVTASPEATGFNDLTFVFHTPPGGLISKLSMELTLFDAGSLPVNVDITVKWNGGADVVESFVINQNNNNDLSFFTISLENGNLAATIESVNVSTDKNVRSLENLRVAGVPVPVPASVWAGASLLAGLGLYRRRRQQLEES